MGSPSESESDYPAPVIIPRSRHRISRADVSEHALKVLYRLKDAGFAAYLVGGCVRDLLLGREPKDFDVATDAQPEEVRKLFRNCRLIGRRFRLAHVYFGRDFVEVATFRAGVDRADSQSGGAVVIEDGRILRDNVYGSIEEDARRRDLTINSLYYDIRDFSLRDDVGAMADLEAGVVRVIGDPETRFREDPVRMLRAVRFAAKLGFRIHPQSEAPIFDLGDLLADIAPARLFDETLKLFHSGVALETFELLRHYGLFGRLFPQTEEVLAHETDGFPRTFVSRALANTDERVNTGKPVTPAFLFAALLWESVRRRSIRLQEEGLSGAMALQQAGAATLSEQAQSTAVPKRFSIPVGEIWQLQSRFLNRSGKRALRLLEHPRFRAAYDFMCLRVAAGEGPEDGCEWWTRIQEAESADRKRMVDVPRRRRRGRRKPDKA